MSLTFSEGPEEGSLSSAHETPVRAACRCVFICGIETMAGVAHNIGLALLRLQRFVRAVVLRFYGDSCLQHASALAYTSLLSVVPLLALMFAALKGLGVQRRLEPLLLSRLALDPEVTDQIIRYIDRTNVGTLGALGAAFLIVTVVSVLGSIEASFNHIWRVQRSRTLWRRATDYVSTVLLTPFLLLAAVAITSSVQEQSLLRWMLETEFVGDAIVQSLHLAPIAINFVALAILYAVMPNRRPHLPSLLIAAFVAGCLWQGVQWTYLALQIGVARYNAIYGALSQLPVTLVWLYVSWAVVLAGAEIAAVFEFGAASAESSRQTTSPWVISVHVLLRAADAFRAGGGGVDPAQLALELELDPDAVSDVVERLCAAGLLLPIEDSPRYVLGRDPASIDLVRLDERVGAIAVPRGADARVKILLDELVAERHKLWADRRLVDLLGERG